MLNKSDTIRYSRQIILDGVEKSGQEKLSGARVLVAGAGGLGSPALYYLAAAGVGEIGIADFDTVGLSNLQRQIIHFTDDLGKKKTVSASEKIKKVNPSVKIYTHPYRLKADNIMDVVAGYDVVIDAVDNIAARYIINDCCHMASKPRFSTIDKPRLNSVELIVPNYVIKELYFDFFGEVIKNAAQYDIDVSGIRDAIENIAVEGDYKAFTEIVSTTLNKLSNRDFINFDEKYIKIIMVTYFMISRIYYVKSENEQNKGYVDIALLPRLGVNAPYNAIFEVKYIKKGDFSQRLLDERVSEAKKQLLQYSKAPEFADMENLLKVVFVFCNDKLVYDERL